MNQKQYRKCKVHPDGYEHECSEGAHVCTPSSVIIATNGCRECEFFSECFRTFIIDLGPKLSPQQLDEFMRKVITGIKQKRSRYQNKIKSINRYRDGGSLCFVYDDGQELWIDNRIGSKTCGQFYTAYPNDKDAELIELSKGDIHHLICQILEFNWNDKQSLRERLQRAEQQKDFKPGDMK